MNPFDYVNSINTTKKDLMVDDETEAAYNPYLTNRSLSYFPDSIIAANTVNQFSHLDNKLQYHFLLNIVRKRKRFSKWEKPVVSNDLDAVKEYYGYSNEKARSAMSLLTSDQITKIQEKVSKGGRR